MAFLILIRSGPPFWSILDASGGVLGSPGGLLGAKVEPKEVQKATKMRSEMRYGIGKAILTKMWLSLEPQRHFWEPDLKRNGKRASFRNSYVNINITVCPRMCGFIL